jgi:hypothetical protein
MNLSISKEGPYVDLQDSQACRVSPKTGDGAMEGIRGEIQGLEVTQPGDVQSQISSQLLSGNISVLQLRTWFRGE